MAKEPLTKEVVDEFIKCLLGFETLEEAENKFFSRSSLVENNVVQKYLKEAMGDRLRKYILVKPCPKLSIKNEEVLTEKDLICILRHILKKVNYKLVGFSDVNQNGYSRVYNIIRNT